MKRFLTRFPELIERLGPLTLTLATRAVTATGNVLSTDFALIVNATAGGVALQLPDAGQFPGRNFAFVKTDASGNAVTINPFDAQQIGSANSRALTSQNQKLWIISDGSNWWILAS